jgi:catechol 2,3-dioxygenase-like lactoylglutathione lyase family enzyme
MKRFHVHIAVNNLAESIDFYSALFGAQPTVSQPDYAKWMLDDPRINFAISALGAKVGLDHLGIQVDSDAELGQISQQLTDAVLPVEQQTDAACCYAKSDKYWTIDPQGIAWEAFHSLASIPVFGEDTPVPVKITPSAPSACCAPTSKGGCQ